MSKTNFTEIIRFRAPATLRPRLKAIAKFKGTKYQHEARTGVIKFVEAEESSIKEQKSAKKGT